MSAAAASYHRGNGSGSIRSTPNSVGRERMTGEKGSSGTMQLLDRLGYGLVSLSPSPNVGEEGRGKGSFDHHAHTHEPAEEKSCSAPVRSMDPAVEGTP